MAVRSTEIVQSEKSILKIEIDNGDLLAFKSAMEQYGFISEEALLRYVLVALLASSDNTLYVKKDGNIVAVKIAPSLLRKESPTDSTDSTVT